MLPTNVLYYGKEDALPEARTLRAGPLTVQFEAGDLRFIRIGSHEVLRRVYVAVRDHNWGTVPPEISDVSIQEHKDSFHIEYDCAHRQADIDFAWRAVIDGSAQGEIRFSMDGEARSTFRRNRIGFCVLHPAAAAGAECTVEHVSGETQESQLPVYIAPHQPFLEMRAITHEVTPGIEAEVLFDGDIFEMEDQRNWTDASYKTYCTPLRIPYPVQVEAGTRVQQSVTVRLHGSTEVTDDLPDADDAATPAVFTVTGEPTLLLPRLGLGLPSHGRPHTLRESDRLAMLRLSHLRLDLDLGLYPDRPPEIEDEVEDALRSATEQVQAIGAALEVALFVTDNAEAELTNFARLAAEVQPPVLVWLIFHRDEPSTGEQWVAQARAALAPVTPNVRIGGGTNAYFTQLNRNRPVVEAMDMIVYSVNPQVHAFDNTSLVETLPMHRVTVESARRFTYDVPLAITPITLRPRFNPDATGEAAPVADTLPPEVDTRQMSLFGAAWTVASLKYVAASGVVSATYYETTGWRGVMELEQGSPMPHLFPSIPGSVFPMFHVFADVGAFAGARVLPTVTSDALRVDGLALQLEGRRRILLANMTAQPQRVTLHGLGARPVVRLLDETTVMQAMQSPEEFRKRRGESLSTVSGKAELTLRPYAVARLDDSEP